MEIRDEKDTRTSLNSNYEDNLNIVIPDGFNSFHDFPHKSSNFQDFQPRPSYFEKRNQSQLHKSLFSSFQSAKLSEMMNSYAFSRLNSAKQLETIISYIPKFTTVWSLCPVFTWRGGTSFSITYKLYFKLYRMALLKCLILFVVSIIMMVLQLLIGDNENAEFLVTFGTPLLGLVGLAIYEKNSERMILKEANREEQGWSQNRFALLFENIDRKGTKEEFRTFLEMVCRELALPGKIIDIMFLQDCGKYSKIKKMYYSVQHAQRNQMDLTWQLLEVDREYSSKKVQLDEFVHYRGKAIVIFENINMKEEIHKHFKIPLHKYIYYKLCCCCAKTRLYKFRTRYPKTSRLPEPDDFAFENVHYSKKWIFFVEILVYSIGLGMVGVGMTAFIFLKLESIEESVSIPKFRSAAICVLINACLNIFGDRLFGRIIRRKKSTLDYERMTFFKRLNFLIFNVYYCVLENTDPESFMESLYYTAIILAFSMPAVKIALVLIRESLRQYRLKKLHKMKDIFSKYTREDVFDIVSKQYFDFPSAVGDLAAYVFICSGFYFVAKIPLILLIVLGLVINIIVDKWIILKYTAPVQIVSPNIGLHFFSILKWDIRLQLLSLAALCFPYYQTEYMQPIIIFLIVVFGLSMILPLPISLHKQWKREWERSRMFVKYDEVSRYFKHTFQQKYPLDIY